MSKLYCDNCGAEVKASDEYCDNCGFSFVDTDKVAKEKENTKLQKTIDGFMTLGDIVKVLLIIASVILLFASISQLGSENQEIGVSLLIDAILTFGFSFISPLIFYWLSYILDDIHAIRKSLEK